MTMYCNMDKYINKLYVIRKSTIQRPFVPDVKHHTYLIKDRISFVSYLYIIYSLIYRDGFIKYLGSLYGKNVQIFTL